MAAAAAAIVIPRKPSYTRTRLRIRCKGSAPVQTAQHSDQSHTLCGVYRVTFHAFSGEMGCVLVHSPYAIYLASGPMKAMISLPMIRRPPAVWRQPVSARISSLIGAPSMQIWHAPRPRRSRSENKTSSYYLTVGSNMEFEEDHGAPRRAVQRDDSAVHCIACRESAYALEASTSAVSHSSCTQYQFCGARRMFWDYDTQGRNFSEPTSFEIITLASFLPATLNLLVLLGRRKGSKSLQYDLFSDAL